MNKITKITALLMTSLYSVTLFAHTGHGNNNIFHSHNETNYFLVMLIIGLLIGFVTYYNYKKNSRK